MNMNKNVWWVLVPYFLFLLLLLFLPSSSSSFCNHLDTSALLQLKYSLNTSNDTSNGFPSKTESWNNGKDCCEWDGVTCDIISGHVIGLDLSFGNLEGQLHPNSTIFSLTHLQRLNLASNHFFGDIPSTISHLSKLLSLDLASYDPRMRLDPYTWNKLIQNATNLSVLNLDGVDMSCIGESSLSLLTNLSSSLISLSLQDTKLQGNLSSDILSLPNLQHLDLFGNEKMRGELPKSNWSTPLRYLDLSYTAFSGNIPDSIGHLKSLNHLDLSQCQFDGLLPSSLFTLTQLSFLDLRENKLEGPVPSEINKLSNLRVLWLSDNKLNGTIPRWCYSLPSLLNLDLSDNHLTGSIGEFSSYSLERLSLSNNTLQGNLSGHLDFYHFSKLKSLSILDLSHNSFLSINFDSTAGYILPNLRSLYLSSCNINSFPKFLAPLQNLRALDLSHNSFLSINFGSTADYILPNLKHLYLSSCNINTFPKFLAQLQNLRALDLSHNNIRGSIPQFHEKLLHSWNKIWHIDLSFNKLQGDLPIPPNRIAYFSVSNNELTGNIPSAMCNASSLSILNLAHNNLTGQIPPCLGTLPYLWALDLQKNNLYGNIPGNFSKEYELETIKLNGNQLDGPLPRSLAHCTNLQVLDLADNNIEDTFPHWLESLQQLQVLSLRSNKFHGVITCFGAKHPFPRLRIFDVSNNSFSGPLPASYIKNFQGMVSVNDSQTGSIGLKFVGSTGGLYNDSVVVVMKGRFMELVRILTIFTTIDLSNNMFEGELPKVIGELHSLIGLNLSHNAITGTIPRSFGNLRNLEWLDLSWNQLTGAIPVALKNLNFLAVLDLSQNQFEGMIPTGGQFNTFGNDSYAGNPMLCGIPLSKSCNKNEDWPPHSTFHHEESGFGWKAVAVGYACGLLFGMLLGYNVLMTGKPQWLARLVEGMLN